LPQTLNFFIKINSLSNTIKPTFHSWFLFKFKVEVNPVAPLFYTVI